MQLEFDWIRRERYALANVEKLAQVGVSDGQLAVVFLMQVHPDTTILEGDAKLATLPISLSEAARWLKRNCPIVRDLAFDPSVFRRAVLRWEDQCIATIAKRHILFSFTALAEWFEAAETDAESLRAAWESLTRRDPARPSLTERDPSLSEGLNSKNSFQSINQDTAEIFVGLDGAAWERVEIEDGKEDRRLHDLLRAWWTSGGSDCGLDVNHVLGAILAARSGGNKTDPERYARRCLEMGVKQNWINKASAWRKQMSASERRTVPVTQYGPGGASLDWINRTKNTVTKG